MMVVLERALSQKYKIADIAAQLGVTAACIYKWSKRGLGPHKLPLIRVGRSVFVGAQDLNDFLAATSKLDEPAVQPTERTAPQVERAQRAADTECAAAGW